MTEIYTKAQIDSQATLIGEAIKSVKDSSVQVTQLEGQSTALAVSQKLFTDTIGDIDAILDKVNGVVV